MKIYKNIEVNLLDKKITIVLNKSSHEVRYSEFLKLQEQLSELSLCHKKVEDLIKKVEGLEKKQDYIINELKKINKVISYSCSSGSVSSNSGGIGGDLVFIWANGYFTGYTYSEKTVKKYTRRGEFLGDVEIPLKLVNSTVNTLSDKFIVDLEFNAEFSKIENVIFSIKLKDGRTYQVPYSFTASRSSGGYILNKTRHIRFSVITEPNSEIERIESNYLPYLLYDIGVYNYIQKGLLIFKK